MEVEADAVDPHRVRWASHAIFAVGRSGVVTSDARSLSGSYVGIDSMGLFSTMTHTGTPSDAYFPLTGDGYPVTLHAIVDGHTEATAVTTRVSPIALGVTSKRFTVAKDGIDGEFFEPRRTAPRAPAVLLIGGSEGGLSQVFGGELLAADGYPTLDVAYFADAGLPSSLKNIPLEYFQRAAKLLQSEPHVQAGNIVVWGVSRGSEAAVLTAADFPSLFDGVIAAVPNDRAVGAYPGPGTAWTRHGHPIATATYSSTDPDPHHDPGTFLPITKVRGPVLTICGGADQTWNSCGQAAALQNARVHTRAHPRDVALTYPSAGHQVGSALRYYSINQPAPGGGSIENNAAASAAARTQVLTFLSKIRTSQ